MTATLDLRINSLAAMARAVGHSQPLPRLLEIAAREARVAVQAATVSISALEPGAGILRTIINVGNLGPDEVQWPSDEVYSIQPGSNLGLVVDELQTWTASIVDPHCPDFERELLMSLGKGSSLGAPIIVDGRLWGEFYATRQVGRTPFSDTDGFYVQALTAILAGAISRWLREESLELLAYRDPLTGLLNRRALDNQAAQAFDVPTGTSRSVTVVAVDINRLKRVNDTLGHEAGDQLIQSVARSLLKTFGRLPGSLVARVGGDEFAVLVSGHEPGRVIEAADSLCRQRNELGLGAGVSTGAASAVLTSDSTVIPADLFAAADRAQYQAKRETLGHTVVASGLP
jgi:diguanylate cyclase (GGDEF)-like protein